MSGGDFGSFMSGASGGASLGKGIKDARDRRALDEQGKHHFDGGLTQESANSALSRGIDNTLGATSTGLPDAEALGRGVGFSAASQQAKGDSGSTIGNLWSTLSSIIGGAEQ